MITSESSDPIHLLAIAISKYDVKSIKRLIGSKCKNLETVGNIKVSRNEYLNWLVKQMFSYRTESANQTITYMTDICNGCQAGCTIIIFDEGRFPKQESNALFKYTAWNIEVEKGFITGITFCHSTEKLRTHDDYAF